MKIAWLQVGRVFFFFLFLGMIASALWASREFSSALMPKPVSNSEALLFSQIFSDFDNKPWEDGFGVLDKEIFPVYRFENKITHLNKNHLELEGYAFYIEGKHLDRKWKALVGLSTTGSVKGIKLMELDEPMGLKQIFMDENNFLNFYKANRWNELKNEETPMIQGAYGLSKSLDDEIRNSLLFFEKNRKVFEKRHPRQKNKEGDEKTESKTEELLSDDFVF